MEQHQHQQQQQQQQQQPQPIHVIPPPQSHPSYPDMIAAAIVWNNGQGKEGGSSKRAIAKYIDRFYTNLPPGHEALLVHNLKRMKAMGQLVMVKNSYQLPVYLRSAQTAPAPVPTPPPPVPTPSLSPKRRGRPPKPKPTEPNSTQPSPQPQQEKAQQVVTPQISEASGTQLKRGRGRPPKKKDGSESGFVSVTQAQPINQAQPISQYQPPTAFQVQLETNNTNGNNNGGGDGSAQTVVKRRPGRPPKKPKVDVPGTQQQQQKTVSYSVAANGVAVAAENVVVQKRRPGRPARSGKVGGGVVQRKVYYKPSGKPRGRPRKNVAVGGVGVGLGGAGIVGAGVKRRGRPPKLGVGVAMGMKRRGRPPKGLVGRGVNVGGVGVGGPVKAKGKTRGWPKGKPRGTKKVFD